MYRIKGTRNSIETVVREPQPPETDKKGHQVPKQIQNGTKQRPNVAYSKQTCHLVSLFSSLCNEWEENFMGNWKLSHCNIVGTLERESAVIWYLWIFRFVTCWARFKFLAIWGIWWGCYWIKRLAHHLQGLPSGMGGAAPTGEFAPSSPSRRGDSLPGPWMVTPSCWASSSWSA